MVLSILKQDGKDKQINNLNITYIGSNGNAEKTNLDHRNFGKNSAIIMWYAKIFDDY